MSIDSASRRPDPHGRWKGLREGWRKNRKEWMVAGGCFISALVLYWMVFKEIPKWRLVWPTRVERGLSVSSWHLAQTQVWWSLLGSAVLLTLMGVTARLWTGRLPELAQPSSAPAQGKPNGRWVLALLLIVVCAGALRMPRMDLSLYNDEVYGFQKYIAGRMILDEQSQALEWQAVPWTQTWWENHLGNNFPLFSALARLAHESWVSVTGSVPGEVHAWAIRLPSLIGGLASLVLVALWMHGAGLPRAALMTALTLALHPAHIRYSTEARGYGMAFAAVIAVAWFWWLALHQGRWRWWAAFAASEVVLLLSYPGSVYWLVALNLGTFGWMSAYVLRERRRQTGGAEARFGHRMLLRWLVASAVAAAVFMTLGFPQIWQAAEAHADPQYMKGRIPLSWWADTASFLFYGVLWSDGKSIAEGIPSLGNLPYLLALGAFAVPLLALVLSLQRRHSRCIAWWLLTLSVPLSVIFAWMHNASRGVIVHHWYTIKVLPLLVATLAASHFASLSQFPTAFQRLNRPFWLALWVVWLALGAHHWRGIADTPKEMLKPVVETVRGDIFPGYVDTPGEQALFAGFYSNANVYDPHLIVLANRADLDALLARARREKRPLYVTHGFLPNARRSHPELTEALHDEDVFELVRRFDGLGGHLYTHYLFRWEPDATDGAALSL